ncbi:MAG: pyridoxamine 5'-phosphate oxidase family protein [Thermodesulfovibrionia bacterium]|nr:pyridoxamine 5'-phosphate oxidase family protein [Thermodesulfovibrionia bacterium]
MDLKKYFETANGTGVLSTSDSDGKVNAAIYGRPHIFDDGTLAFLMRQKLTHHNLQSNPSAMFLFHESSPGYSGVRIYLKKIKEETESPLIAKMTRGSLTPEEDKAKGPKYLVHFKVEKILPLIGSGTTS